MKLALDVIRGLAHTVIALCSLLESVWPKDPKPEPDKPDKPKEGS